MDFRELDALKCNMEQFPPLTKGQFEAIKREKKIEHVWSSNALEGGTLDKYETASILETGAPKRRNHPKNQSTRNDQIRG